MKLLSVLLFLTIPFGVRPLPAQTKDTMTPQAQRKIAPDFTLPDADEKPITLSAYRGKVVLLDFWATWCHGCKTEIPWYIEFSKQYQNQCLAVIGVSMDDEGMKVVKPFLAARKINYPVVIGNDALGKQFNLESMPLTLLIDRDGRIAVSHAGIVDKEDFESHIRELLR
jgi:cytochrome c biogenesis protein CcmG/thiol:disulfide interchange protein DsbE